MGRRLGRVGSFIVAVTFFVAIGIAVAVLVRPPSIGGQLFVPSSPTPRTVVSFSAPASVEQVAAKVLPSVVTLENQGRR
jgi:hypothetical protein